MVMLQVQLEAAVEHFVGIIVIVIVIAGAAVVATAIVRTRTRTRRDGYQATFHELWVGVVSWCHREETVQRVCGWGLTPPPVVFAFFGFLFFEDTRTDTTNTSSPLPPPQTRFPNGAVKLFFDT
jgi:hypothetical protein